MKIAVAGKGGSGKTTIAATLARLLGRAGHRVLALDADTNPMMGISLGLGPEETDLLVAVRQGLDRGDLPHQPSVSAMIDVFGREVPDGVRLVVASKIEHVDPGCPCCGVSPESLLHEFEAEGLVIADLEAGVGALSRLPENSLDALIVVVEPSLKSSEVARIVLSLASERHPETRKIVVLNKVDGAGDAGFEALAGSLDGIPTIEVPMDAVVTEADRSGRAPIDQHTNGDSPAVRALRGLADMLSADLALANTGKPS